ncbi:MAG: hypothetical protein ACTSXJ_05620 [Candidatus Baldrarchaeia archaeon]
MAVRIEVHPEKCTACLLCQLACSFKNSRSFNPHKSYIRILRRGASIEISFLDGCRKCGECISWCVYGALSKRR